MSKTIELNSVIGKKAVITDECKQWGYHSRITEIMEVWTNVNESYFKCKRANENYLWLPERYVIIIEENKSKINIYPLKCNLCHSPARKINNTTFCSNYKCKSRNQFKWKTS